MKRALFTGGGSAGHVLPAVPVMQALIDSGVAVSFVGSTTGLEEQYLSGVDVAYHGIASGKLRRYFAWQNLTDVFQVARGLWQSLVLLGRVRPDVIFSKGGFVSFPVVLAGWLRRIPIVAHESDFSPGLANRLAMPFVDMLCTSFASSRPPRLRGEIRHTGSPVRVELLNGSRQRGRELLEVEDGRPVVVVTGGSLGADVLNAVVREAAERLVERCCLVHVCGPGKRVAMQLAGYHQFEFVTDDWGDLLAAADVVVSRAGANSLFEVLALGKPNLLVPLSRAASRGDQIENANFAARAGYSRVIEEAVLDADRLVRAVSEMLSQQVEWEQKVARFEALPSVELLVSAMHDVCRESG